MAEPLSIKLIRNECPVTLEMPDSTTGNFTIKEMMGSQRDAFLERMNGRYIETPTGKTILKKFANFQADLISQCLYDAAGTAVPVDTIAKWPASAQKALFEKCQEVNGMNAETEGDEPKNS